MLIKNQSGMSIIEIIVAMGLFVIIAGSVTVAVLSSFSSTRLAKEELKATALAEEGLEAVQSIRNQDWDNLSIGTHGLSNSGGTWIFSGSSDVDASGKYTRSVTISAVERDDSGDVIASGGTVDDQTYYATTNVNWDFTPTRNNTIELVAYLTNWQTSQSQAGVSGACSDQASCLTVNIAGATASGQELQGITLGNSDSDDAITINQMTISWSGSSATSVIEIKIDGDGVWSGDESSGQQIDITDATLAANSSNIPLDYIKFDEAISGATVSIEFEMTDSSTQTVSGISL